MIINPYRFATAAPATPVGRAVIYTGNGSTQSITGAGFSPDLVAIKQRAGMLGWRWVDNVRGVGKSLNSGALNAESTEATGLTSFDADGFSVGADVDYNTNASNYLALCLQRDAGAFDIVSYTGTGVARTVAHGLGVTPELIIIKDLTLNNWMVFPGPLSSPETKFLRLNSNLQVTTAGTSAVWNNTAPNSTVFTVGTDNLVNQSAHNYIAYVFSSKAGSVKVGSYVGDGATPGPFVTTGFKPRFVLVKASSATGDWIVFDDARDVSNPSGIHSKLNTTAAEATLADGVDLQSTGFQFTDTGAAAGVNTNGVTYVYLAVA